MGRPMRPRPIKPIAGFKRSLLDKGRHETNVYSAQNEESIVAEMRHRGSGRLMPQVPEEIWTVARKDLRMPPWQLYTKQPLGGEGGGVGEGGAEAEVGAVEERGELGEAECKAF